MKDRWADKSRLEKIAGAMYPHLLSPQVRGEMVASNEEQRTGIERRTTTGQRQYGVKPDPAPNVLDGLKSLRRVEVKTTKSWWDR